MSRICLIKFFYNRCQSDKPLKMAKNGPFFPILSPKTNFYRRSDNTSVIKKTPKISPGLIFGGAYFRDDICVKNQGGLFSEGLIFGGAYYRDFTVYIYRVFQKKGAYGKVTPNLQFLIFFSQNRTR